MDRLVESIVQSDAGDRLTTGQMQALIGLLSAAPAVTLPSTHILFQKLSVNYSQLSTSEESRLCVRLSLLLCADVASRDVISRIIETHACVIESAIAPSIASLSTSGLPDSYTLTKNEGEKLLSLLILVFLAAGEAKMKAKDLVEFVGACVEGVVHVLVILYVDVCGVAPGVAPVVSGIFQTYLALRIVQMLHELTFWTTYEDLYTQLGIGTHNQKVASNNTADTPLHVSAGPYRHHVGQITSFLIKYNFCSFAITHMAKLTHSFSEPLMESRAHLRVHFLLFQSLLTQTDQFVSVLRKSLFKHRMLANVCDPLMWTLTHEQSVTPEHTTLLLQCVAVSATLSFCSSEGHQYWSDNAAALVKVVDGVMARAAECISASGEITFAELVAQLVRLVVNSHSTAPATAILQLWSTHLDDAGKQRVARLLSNPRIRSRPLDIFSPVYEGLRPVFRINGGNAVPVAARRHANESENLQQGCNGCLAGPRCGGRGRNRSRSRGRGGEGRRGSGGRRGRPHSRSSSCPRRHRPSRRQRMRRRFQILAQFRSQGAVLNAGTRELLDAANADAESSRSSSSSDDAESTGATVALPPPDVSRWRRGPPPRSIPARYICSLSHSLIRSVPVLSSTGYLFDQDIILDYLKYYQVCPVSGTPLLLSDLVVDTQLKEELDKIKDNFV